MAQRCSIFEYGECYVQMTPLKVHQEGGKDGSFTACIALENWVTNNSLILYCFIAAFRGSENCFILFLLSYFVFILCYCFLVAVNFQCIFFLLFSSYHCFLHVFFTCHYDDFSPFYFLVFFFSPLFYFHF